MCQQQSGAVGRKNSLSRPPFYLAGALRNNHPGHAPLLPIISLIYDTFVCASCFSLLHRSSILPHFNCLCLPWSPSLFCSRHVLLLTPALLFSLLIPFFYSLPCLFTRGSLHPNVKNAQGHSLKSQPNLHYPALSFYPLITYSTPFSICVYPPPSAHQFTHPCIIYNWILSDPGELLFLATCIALGPLLYSLTLFTVAPIKCTEQWDLSVLQDQWL